MALSQKKKLKLELEKRRNIAYPPNSRYPGKTGFMDANWDAAAEKYIATGKVTEHFPTEPTRCPSCLENSNG